MFQHLKQAMAKVRFTISGVGVRFYNSESKSKSKTQKLIAQANKLQTQLQKQT